MATPVEEIAVEYGVPNGLVALATKKRDCRVPLQPTISDSQSVNLDRDEQRAKAGEVQRAEHVQVVPFDVN